MKTRMISVSNEAYKLTRMQDRMLIIVIGAREDAEAYETAYKRIRKHNP